jgi:predicted amidohydrolase
VFPFGDAKIGVIICRDQNYPELCRALTKAGAQFIYILSAHFYGPKEARWKLEKNRAIPITRAVENKVYVLLSNFVGSHLGKVSLGNSLIADPDGAVVVSAGETEEGLLSVSIDDFSRRKNEFHSEN